jgi:hypothetical protein
VLRTPTDSTFKRFIRNSCIEFLPSVHFVCHCNLALGMLLSVGTGTGPQTYVVYAMDVLFCDTRTWDVILF